MPSAHGPTPIFLYSPAVFRDSLALAITLTVTCLTLSSLSSSYTRTHPQPHAQEKGVRLDQAYVIPLAPTLLGRDSQ
jgi:hypothetical protein